MKNQNVRTLPGAIIVRADSVRDWPGFCEIIDREKERLGTTNNSTALVSIVKRSEDLPRNSTSVRDTVHKDNVKPLSTITAEPIQEPKNAEK